MWPLGGVTRDQKVAMARRLSGRGLSHAEIGERFGVTKATVGKWLRLSKQRSEPAVLLPMIPRRGPKFTPPCLGCRYPLLARETCCPRCGRGVNGTPSRPVDWTV